MLGCPPVCPSFCSQFTSTLAFKSTAFMNLKFHMQHDQTAGHQTCKSQPGREFKMVASSKKSKTITINFFSRMDLFSETTEPMVLKFHLQQDQTLGLQNDKIQGDRESKMATNAKNSKTNISIFFPRMAWYIWLKH